MIWLGSQATWVKELLSTEIHWTSQRLIDRLPTLIMPLTASTRWAAVDLSTEASWTLSGLAHAVVLPARALQMQDAVQVGLELAQRVAHAHKRPEPQLQDVPPVVHSAVALVGGSPRLLSYLWEAIAERSGGRTEWHEGNTARLDPRPSSTYGQCMGDVAQSWLPQRATHAILWICCLLACCCCVPS